MLVSLSVKNFAIIDNINIDFEPNMTVLTGETGAGKSLIIDALSLLFGSRAQNDMIRFGENKASIVCAFSNYNNDIISLLDSLGIDYDKDDNLIIKRELYSNGKSICRVNNEIITLSDLKRFGELLGDIHSQNDSLGLINPKNYLMFIRNSKINKLIDDYKLVLKEYNESKSLYSNKLKRNEELKEKMDFLTYQFKELKSYNLSINEEEELKNELSSLSNYENINENIKSFKDIFDKENALDLIYESLMCLSKLKNYDSRFVDLYDQMNEAYYNIESICMSSLFKTGSYDTLELDNRIDEINSKLSIYSDLKRKYRKSTSEIIEYSKKIEEEIKEFETFDLDIENLKNRHDELKNKLLQIAYNIRKERIDFSIELKEKVILNLSDLELKNTKFDIIFNEIDENNIIFYNDGIDTVDFLLSFNKGESLKPLSKVASGGELSRFMLALKTVLSDNLNLQIKVFDEVDRGVSGKVAYAIAKKLKEISKSSQVICISHLPQVASIANNHLKISKITENGRTFTCIDKLNSNERIEEIAYMLSNGNISEVSRNMAIELMKGEI